jgi:hypothetical protein
LYIFRDATNLAYFHGFGLLAYKKVWPKVKKEFEEMQGKLNQGFRLILLTYVGEQGDEEGVAGKLKEGLANVANELGQGGGES